MVNVYKPHVWVLIEDDRNRELLNGFIDHHAVDEGQIRPLPEAGGWTAVLKEFEDVYIKKLRDFPHAHVIMLIDYDNSFETRRAAFQSKIPADLADRVFVLGCADEPEALSRVTGVGREKMGWQLADECDTSAMDLWNHEHLKQNDKDRQRLATRVHPFCFAPRSEARPWRGPRP